MKICILGLDCAAPDIVFGDERLTNIRRLMELGLYGRLESVVPPITVPAWMCMSTSRDPGSLGIYGFRNRTDHSYSGLGIATSQWVKHETVWDAEVLGGKLKEYEWLHLHHEDFTGQYSKFFLNYAGQPWLTQRAYYDLFAEAHLDLYAGDARAADARMTAGWPVLEKSFLLGLSQIKLVMLELRARAALAAAAGAADPRLAAVEKWARVLERDDWRRVAVRNAELLTTKLRPDGRLLRTYKDGRAKIPAFLEDYALLADASHPLSECTSCALAALGSDPS